MDKRRVLVMAAALVVLASVGVGVWLWRRGAKAPAPAAGESQEKEGAAAKGKGSQGGGGPPPEMRLSQDVDPKGTLRLEGQVIDAQEQPVGGAVVALSSVPPREAKSEEDGSFAFPELVGREYQVEARKGDAFAGPITIKLTTKSEPVILRMKEVARLEVTVISARDKKPIAGADVELRALSPERAKTGADGKAILHGIGDGWHSIKVSAAGFAPATRLFSSPGTPGLLEKQIVELQVGGKVSGRVVDPAGKPIAGAQVSAADASALFSLFGPGDAAVTDANGAWSFAALPAGTFRFTAQHGKWAPATSPPITLDGKTERTGIVLELEAGARLAGVVQTKKGEPVAAAAVRVAVASEGIAWDITRQAYTDERGAFDLEGLPRQAVDVLALHENASSSPKRFDLAANPEQTGVVITLDLEGAIAGIVVTSAGEPIPEAQVSAMPDVLAGDVQQTDWRLRGIASDVADAGGRFHLAGLREGAWRVRATRAGTQQDQLWLRPGVAARTGDLNVRIVLDPDGKVKGRVAFKDGSVPETFAVGIGMATPTPFSGTKGAFLLEDAPAGKHGLAITGPGFSRKLVHDVEVKAGQETDIGTVTVEKGRSISGRVLRPDGRPVAGAKVMAGKQLLGDGGSMEMSSGFMSSQMGIQNTTSADDGSFLIAGIGERRFVLVAEHPEEGRSKMVPIARGSESVQVDLVLSPLASLEGKVTRGGQPAASIMVLANPQAAVRGNFIVTSGADGTYRFDRLTPDAYLISAMKSTQGMMGGDLITRRVVLESGKSTRLDLALPPEGVDVTVKITPPVTTAQVILFSGRVQVMNADQFQEAFAERGDGTMGSTIATKDKPPRFEDVAPGEHTLCVIPIPGDLNDPATIARLQEEGEDLPITCEPETIRPSPPQQELAITLPK